MNQLEIVDFYKAKNRTKEMISLAHIEAYAKIYREYLSTNNLQDDTDEISIFNLIFFVEEIIIKDDERYELI